MLTRHGKLLTLFLLSFLNLTSIISAEEISPKQQSDEIHAGCSDGSKLQMLAFQRLGEDGSEIGIVDEEGKEAKILAKGALHHSTGCWSLDGQQIAFTTVSGAIHEIFVIRADGSGKRQITSLGQYSFFCDWSSDGRKLLFKTGKNDGHWSIAEVSLESKKVRVIAKNESGYRCLWSHIGDTIVTVRELEEYEIGRDGKKFWVTRAHSSDLKYELTTRTTSDGSSVAYISQRNMKGSHVLVKLRGMRLSQFSFSPDGKKIAFFAEPAVKIDENGAWERPDEHLKHPRTGIYTVDISGENIRLVVRGGFRATWKPR